MRPSFVFTDHILTNKKLKTPVKCKKNIDKTARKTMM